MRGDGRLFHRRGIPWIAYYRQGKEIRESAAGAIKAAELKRGRPLTENESTQAAMAFLKNRLREVLNEADGIRAFVGPKQQKLTVEQLLQSYEQDCEVRKVKGLAQVRSHLKHIRQEFGNDRAVSVSRDLLVKYISLRQDEGAKAATINRELEGLQAAFNLALVSGTLAFAPKFPSLKEDNARQGFFEHGDFTAVLCKLADPGLKDFLEFFYWTGMRPKEIRSLTWPSFDRQTWTLRLQAKDAKTGNGRVIALEGPLREIMQRRVKARRFGCDLIFYRGTQKPKPVGEFRKAWRTACRLAGVSGKNPYDLRRTFVRNAIRAGVSETTVMRITGHRTRAMLDRYNIVSEKDLQEAITKTAAYVETLPESQSVVPIVRQAASRAAK